MEKISLKLFEFYNTLYLQDEEINRTILHRKIHLYKQHNTTENR